MARKASQGAVGRATVAQVCDACGRATYDPQKNPGGPPGYIVIVEGIAVRTCTEPRACIAAAKAAGTWMAV